MASKLLSLLAIFLLPILCKSQTQIGLLTDHDDPNIKYVFHNAIEAANKILETPLRGMTLEVSYGNVFDASKKLCRLLQDANGISAIFGPSARSTASHLISICDEKEIPYIDTTQDFNDNRTTINLYPQPQQLAKAIYDIIKSFGWQRFTFLYESSEYLEYFEIFDKFISTYGNGGPAIIVRRYDIGLDQNYFNVLRRIKKSREKSMVIVGSLDTITELLRQAQQVGLITEDHEYIIGNLDFQTVDIRPYQFSECNITTIRIVSPENEKVIDLMTKLGNQKDWGARNISFPITTSMALLYDAVQLFAEVTKNSNFKTEPVICFRDDYWEHGSSLYNLLSSSFTTGLTGNINFNFGLRKEFSLDIIELTSSGLTKIGTWDNTNGVDIKRTAPSVKYVDADTGSLVNKTFVVLTALTPPYGMLKTSTDKLTGNDQFEGFGIDLIKQLAYKLGFNYTFRLQEDNNYGSFNTTSNEATGMVKELREGRADLAITDLTITSERAAGADFTIPFMNLGVSILYRKAQKEPPKLFSFMDPFSKEVWLYLGVSFVSVSLSFFILGRLSPTEWDNPYPCIEEPTELENQFSLNNSCWMTVGALLQQGSEIAPKAASTRTVASIWWFFTIIMVASYTANLAAFLTIESTSSPINDVNDLEKNKGGVQYGAKRGGATLNFFQSSKKYKKMNDYMKNHPDLLPSTNEEGVERVLTENYAFLMESTTIEYNVERNCNLTQIGDTLDEKGYGIAMRKDWPYRDQLNFALLELQEAGVLSKLKMKWWQEVTEGCSKKKKEADKAEALGMPNLGGVYFVLLLGSVFAAGFGVIKWVLYVIRKAYFLKVPVKVELMEELKFVLDCSKNTKILKTSGSSYSRNSSITMGSVKEVDEESAKLTH